MQSSQSGQEPVAHPTHTSPAPHGVKSPTLQGYAHCPLPKTQIWSGSQPVTSHPTGPVALEVIVVDVDELLVLLEVSAAEVLEEPPAPSTTTVPPQPETSSARAAIRKAMVMMASRAEDARSPSPMHASSHEAPGCASAT
jgi:hypothetical protein